MLNSRFLIAFFALGCVATTVQILVLRELFVILSGNELCVGLALGSWLIGIVLGAVVVAPSSDRVDQRSFFALFLLLLPALAMAVTLVIRSLRTILGIPAGEHIPPEVSAPASLACIVPIGALVGLAFPLAAAAYREFLRSDESPETAAGSAASVTYALESLGSLVAGVLLSFYLVSRFDPFRILTVAAFATGLVAFLLSFEYRWRWWILLWPSLFLCVFMTGLDLRVEAWSNQKRFDSFAQGDWVRSLETPYQHLDLGKLGEQYTLYGNGSLLFSFPDTYTEQLTAHFWLSLHRDPKRILLLGGHGGRYVPAMLAHTPKRIDYVELDSGVIEMTAQASGDDFRTALERPMVHIHVTDGRRFVRETSEQYDVVISAMPDPSTALLNRFYTEEFYEEVRRVLAPNGIFITQVEAPGTFMRGEVGTYAASVYWTLRFAFPNTGLLPDGEIVFVSSVSPLPPLEQPEIFVKRLRDRGVSSRTFVPEAILAKILSERVATVQAELENLEPEFLNSDSSPQSYLRRLVLWARESGSDSLAVAIGWMDVHRRFLLFLLLLAASVPWVFLGIAPKVTSLTACVAATGCTGMGLEMLAIYMYQNLYGCLYQEVGLLVAVFMGGLTVGARIGNWFARHLRGLTRLLLSFCAFTLLFTRIIEWIPDAGLSRAAGVLIYCGLILTAGILVGAVFPLAVSILSREQQGKVGAPVALVDAADHLGGALGAFLIGVVLFPLLGATWTCILLALGLACVGTGFLLATYVFR